MFILMLGLIGCGGSPDSLMKDQISYMNDLADALEKNQPESKLTDIKNRMDTNGKKIEALKMSDEEKKKLFEKHKDELMKATQRLLQAMMKSKEFGGLFDKFPGMPQMPQMPQSSPGK